MEPVISVDNLVQRVGKKIILNQLSFEVYAECFGVFGTRGTGKTSLLHILAGIDKFKSGQVTVLGMDINRSERYKNHLGLVTQQPSLFPDLRVAENLDFIATLKNANKCNINPLVEQLELEPFLGQPIKGLEAGVYQRLALACALLNHPQILIVDQLIDDIDIYSRRLMTQAISNFLAQGHTCIWGFSNPEYFKLMDRVAWLEGGQITLYAGDAAQQKWQRQLNSGHRGEDDA
ncbi:ABC transporter ATP-binding protein [Peptococcaceae bacterium 1198_IL3148]